MLTVSESTILENKAPSNVGQNPGGLGRPVWEAGTLVVILLAAAVLYVWGLAGNGWANAYYSAAVQAGLHDPVSYFFGSADWGNSVSVDKPPLSLWIVGLSVRIFGLNTWALLLPQAAMTMGSTFLIYRLARRHLPAYAALLSAAVFATTPITVLLARYNNPDPLMVLLMLSALYAGIRATETGRVRWLYVAAGFLALGFLTKQLQAFMVLPAIVLVYCLYVRKSWKQRTVALAMAGLLLAAGSLAFPIAVDLTPPGSRPYVGGSTTNSMLELTLGYNGIHRIMQKDDGRSAALTPQEFQGDASDAGLFRLFNSNYGQESGWLLLPAFMVCVVIVAQAVRRRSAVTPVFALGVAVWMLTTYFVLSFMGNSIHSYYTASIAAPLALCIGIGSHMLMSSSKSIRWRIGSAAAVVLSAIFSNAMWQLSDSYPEAAGRALLMTGLAAGAVLSVPAPFAWVKPVAAWLGIASLLVGPVVCSVLTLSNPQQGSNPLSGGLTRSPTSLSRFLDGVKKHDPAAVTGLAIGVTPSATVSEYLRNAPPGCTWVAATYPGQTAARFQLDLGRPVMPLSGFAAMDPSPTVGQFKELAQAGRICYLVVQPEQLTVPGTSAELLTIHKWVTENFKAEQIDGVTIYDFDG